MGTAHSEFEEIENKIKLLHLDRDKAKEKADELEAKLMHRELEHREASDNLGNLLTRLEKQEEMITQLNKDVEAAKRKAEEDGARLHEDLNKDISALREKIALLDPGQGITASSEDKEFHKQMNVGLFGNTGVGKTSLLNSMKYAIKGKLDAEMKEQAAPPNFQGGHTVRRLPVRITSFITFIDNRGIGPEDLINDGAIDELKRQLEGTASLTEEVDWRTKKTKLHESPHWQRSIYCSILVLDARKPQALGIHGINFLKCLFEWQGCFPLAVITHVDIASSEQLEATKHAIQDIGIVDSFEVANITDERSELDLVCQSSLLRLLERCVRKCNYTYQFRRRVESLKIGRR